MVRRARPAAAVPQRPGRPSAAKRAKVDSLQQVAAAISETTDLPPVVQRMLIEMLPGSLDVCKEQRHKAQHAVVDMLGDIMSNIESSLEHELASTTMKVTELVDSRRKYGAEVANAEAAIARTTSALADEKVKLSTHAASFQAAMREKEAAANDSAETAFEEARHRQKEAAEAFGKAQSARRNAQEALDATRMALESLDAEEAGLHRHMESTERRLRDFQTTALSTFQQLREKKLPVEVEEAAVGEPGDADAEMTPV
mmetsp:Transcript_64344/g.119609  ORF Transcript_64344/g.119609 Transcript_64344/m.119609 type:complete len:257 (-) Transcript_64344:132-902(-)